MEIKKNIIFLGTVGFPYGQAAVQKQLMISKALINAKMNVKVLCIHGTGLHKKEIKKKGNFEGISYIYTSLYTYSSSNKIKRKLDRVFGSFMEKIYLLCHKYDFLIINSRSFKNIFIYVVIAKFKGEKTLLTFVEDPEQIDMGKTIFGRFNNLLFNKFVWKFVDGGLPISERLINKIKLSNSNLPLLKIPPLVDVKAFDRIEKAEMGKYFLYCGAAAYFEVIKFIIDSFNLLKNNEYKLFLITNGSEINKSAIENEINRSGKKQLIKIFSYIEYSELLKLYKNASALLIPLRNNLQDISRFPHKIGEYSASSNPIVTTNVGEIKYYFKDYENALIADSYDELLFAGKMNFIIKNPERAKIIGEKGRLVAVNNFDYRMYSQKLIEYLKLI